MVSSGQVQPLDNLQSKLHIVLAINFKNLEHDFFIIADSLIIANLIFHFAIFIPPTLTAQFWPVPVMRICR